LIEIKTTVAAVQIAEKKVRAERVVAGGNPDGLACPYEVVRFQS